MANISKSKKYKSPLGLMRQGEFSHIPEFDVLKSFTPDLMHDESEGFLNDFVAEIFKGCGDKKADFEKRIKTISWVNGSVSVSSSNYEIRLTLQEKHHRYVSKDFI